MTTAAKSNSTKAKPAIGNAAKAKFPEAPPARASKRVQEHGVALTQTFRQSESDPCAKGQESQWIETRKGTDDDHVLAGRTRVPKLDLSEGLHGALPCGLRVTLQRLCNGGADRDAHSTECIDSPSVDDFFSVVKWHNIEHIAIFKQMSRCTTYQINGRHSIYLF